MKRRAALALLLFSGWMAVLAAQRTFTNPKPEAPPKQLFPNAVSRASLSINSATRAIRDSSRIVAKLLLVDTVK